ncbi:putative HTH-type transcriptional regulator YbdO [compost metagenome]
MIDFEWYRSFVSIYKYETVSKAADSRYLTQPAVSQHLAALESEVGAPLFVRTSRKMIPTDKGKELYARLAPLMEGLENLTTSIKMPARNEVPIIRIGSASDYMTQRILEFGNDLKFRIHAYLGEAEQLLKDLREERVDLIITSQRSQVSGLSFIKLEVETFVLVAPEDYDTPSDNIEKWLNQQPWLSYGLELPIIRRFWRQHFNKRPTWEPAHIIPDLRGILKGIESGMGISILPTYLIRESLSLGKTKVIFPGHTAENDLFLAHRLKDRDHPNLQHAAESLMKLINVHLR